ncbi:hypothetical protein Tco_0584203 [Tanacetum coccineum]
MIVEDLLHLVPNLITKVDSLEIELKQTKLTMGKEIVKLVKKVKKLEDILKRKHVVFTDLEDEEPEDQGRIIQDIDDDPIVSKGDFGTPTKPSGEAQEEEISPTTLEAAKILSKVASQRSKSVDKGKRYKRRKESKGKDIDSGFEEVNTGKAPMIVEETQAPKRTKEQIQQEEASLAEAIRLQTLEEEETAKQVHLDALLAKRIKEEEELIEQQKQRKAQVQFEAQHYTEEDWDAIRAKLEANVELIKNVLGKELPEEDFAKKMVELVNQRNKFFAEERDKARRKVKEEFDKLVKQVESFVPMNIEATKKQKARKGINVNKSPQGDSETGEEESIEAMNPTPLDTKSNIVANWKIFQQGERSIYQIIRANEANIVYMSFGSMLKDFTREDLIELYRTLFDLPHNEDAIWSLPLQQKIISWRCYDKCEVHCLTLEACSIYMLADRKYPLSKDACQEILRMKLLDGKMNEVCYKLLKMIKKQAGEAHNEDTQRNLKFTSEDQVRGGLLGIIVNRLKSGSYRVKSGRHMHKMKDEYGDGDVTLYPTQVFSVNNWALKPNQPKEPPFINHIKEARKGGSSKAPTGSKTGHSKKRKESNSAMDANPSQPPVSTHVDTGMHKEDQQATGGPTSLGVTRCDASADSIAEADPGLSAPNDSIPQQQGMDEGTKNTSFDHIYAGIDPHVLADQTQSVSKGLETVLTQPTTGKGTALLLDKLNMDSPKDDHVIVVDDSDEDEEDEVHTTTNAETEDTLVPKSSSPRSSQIQELTNQILSAHDFSSSLPTELKDLPSKFNELTKEVKGLKTQVYNLEFELPGDLKEIPPKLEDFTKTITSLTYHVAELKSLQWELPEKFLSLPIQVASVQAKLKTLDALPSIFLNVTKALNTFAQVLDFAL